MPAAYFILFNLSYPPRKCFISGVAIFWNDFLKMPIAVHWSYDLRLKGWQSSWVNQTVASVESGWYFYKWWSGLTCLLVISVSLNELHFPQISSSLTQQLFNDDTFFFCLLMRYCWKPFYMNVSSHRHYIYKWNILQIWNLQSELYMIFKSFSRQHLSYFIIKYCDCITYLVSIFLLCIVFTI